MEAVEVVGKRVEDREGVRRGVGGLGEVREVRKRSGRGPEEVWKRSGRGPEEVRKVVGKCGRGGKAQEVTVHYKDGLTLCSKSFPGFLRSKRYGNCITNLLPGQVTGGVWLVYAKLPKEVRSTVLSLSLRTTLVNKYVVVVFI